MTVPENTQAVDQSSQKPNDKEYNFRQLEAKYERKLLEEKQKREEAERVAQEALLKHQQESEDDDSEPYVDHKKLNKTLSKFGQNTQTEIQKAMEMAKDKAKQELKQEMWLEQNPDFFDILQHANKFAEKAPRLAETILRMPEGFERQKLVYENIKTLGIDKPEQKQPSVQEKLDANRKSPYYQPTSVNAGPYNAGMGDFSNEGQKNAYKKLQELKNRLRI